jgi:hypothetical protein
LAKKIPQQNGTKKDMIANMLLDGDKNYSAREIARAVGTTEGNVFKEKSKLRATGLLTDQRLSVLSHSVGDETLTLARAEARTLVSRSDFGSLTDLPPLKPDDVMKMYSEFQDGKTPSEVIAANGFSPMLVEYEYIRFCRMNNLNLKSLAQELVGELRSSKTEHSKLLLQKIEQDGITSNEDIRELVKFAADSSYSGGELSVIRRMRNGESIDTFKPFSCSICGKPMKGAMIEYESEIGRKLTQSIGPGAMHDTCINGPINGWASRV